MSAGNADRSTWAIPIQRIKTDMKKIAPFHLLLAALLLMLTACSGGSPDPAGPSQPGPTPLVPAAEGLLDGLLLRDASGKITGIQINWDPVPDLAAEKIVGYHIYRSNAAIEDSERGNSALWLTDDSFNPDGDSNKTIFPHVLPAPGGRFSFLDPATPEFQLNLGESWHYRISAVNDSGDEGRLSPELTIDVTQHRITSLSSAKVGIGNELIIHGLNFGQFEVATDEVIMVGNVWNPATHVFDIVDLNPVINSWQSTEISVVVPPGATRGRIKVSIDGLVTQSLDFFENADPYITGINFYNRFLNQTFNVSGANFGTSKDSTHFAVVDDVDQNNDGKYNIYTDTSFTFTLLDGTAFGELPLQVSANGTLSNTGFIFLTNQAPVAAFTMNKTSGKVPLQVNFNAGGSTDLEGPIAKYTMDFGDGSAPEEKLAGDTPTYTHFFNASGNYDVVLTVEDSEGLTGTIQKTVNALPSAEVLLIENIDNGQGVGNNYVPNVNAVRDDVGPTGLDLDYIQGGYSVGIGQVAIDNGVRVVIWMRGGPGPGDPIQDWPRNWSTDEKNDLLTILNAGIDLLLISQNHQYTGDDASGNNWNSLYGLTKQTDRIQEPGGSRPFTWMFGCPTDITYSNGGDSIPSSPVCLNGTFPAGVFNPGAAETFAGTGSSGNIPTGLTIANGRIQMGLAVDLSLIGSDINANFVPGCLADEATYPFKLCYSHGLTTAPDSNIGFSGGGYSHTNGTARLWVIGWSYSEMVPTPGTVSRTDVLQNILAWLDSGLTLP
jgi:PKD repeat protein